MQHLISVLLVLAAFLVIACSDRPRYIIQGTVPTGKYEGEWIYSTPAEGNIVGRIDSCRITQGRFRFEGDSEEVRIIRLRPILRFVAEEMLVVTEPGTIHVKVDSVSSVWGTRQNDLMQQWKNYVMRRNAIHRAYIYACQHQAGESIIARLQKEVDSVNEATNTETCSIIHRYPKSTIAAFFRHLTGLK